MAILEVDELTKKEHHAIVDYTKFGYAIVNPFLGGKCHDCTPVEVNNAIYLIQQLDSAFEKAKAQQPSGIPTKVFRGTRAKKSGVTLKQQVSGLQRNYTSTSKNESVAVSAYGGGIIMEIDISEITYLEIANLSHYGNRSHSSINEEEVLLPRNIFFTVTAYFNKTDKENPYDCHDCSFYKVKAVYADHGEMGGTYVIPPDCDVRFVEEEEEGPYRMKTVDDILVV